MAVKKEVWGPAVFIGVLAFLVVGGTVYFVNRADDTKGDLISKSTTKLSGAAQGATIETNYGTIDIEFFTDKAPKTVSNFARLVENEFYNGTKFHRVIPNFMIQGGDPNTKGEDASRYGLGGPGYTFADEINAASLGISAETILALEQQGYKYRSDISSAKLVRGVIAMANSGPNTNGSQFFIVTAAETPWLDGKHTVFGIVTGGMDVVDKISRVPRNQTTNLPNEPVIIERITLN